MAHENQNIFITLTGGTFAERGEVASNIARYVRVAIKKYGLRCDIAQETESADRVGRTEGRRSVSRPEPTEGTQEGTRG